jgi:hypothetical protein
MKRVVSLLPLLVWGCLPQPPSALTDTEQELLSVRYVNSTTGGSLHFENEGGTLTAIFQNSNEQLGFPVFDCRTEALLCLSFAGFNLSTPRGSGPPFEIGPEAENTTRVIGCSNSDCTKVYIASDCSYWDQRGACFIENEGGKRAKGATFFLEYSATQGIVALGDTLSCNQPDLGLHCEWKGDFYFGLASPKGLFAR